MAFTIITQGTVTQGSTATGLRIDIPQSADYFKVVNLTQMAANPNPGVGVMYEWYNVPYFQDGYALQWSKTNSTNAMNADIITSGGFTYYEVPQGPEAAVTGTAITAATPAVVTMTNTYSEGDRVRLYGTTGMEQIGGMEFTISSVSGSGFTLLGLPAAGFAAPATAVVARRVGQRGAVMPRSLFITAISKASQAVVTVSTEHDYVVGQLVNFSVPPSFGMSEISGLTGKVLAVGTYTITVDINSSSFSTFAFPPASASPNAQLFAMLSPAGQRAQIAGNTTPSNVQTGYNVTTVPFQTGEFTPYMWLPAGTASPAGSANDVLVWQACKVE